MMKLCSKEKETTVQGIKFEHWGDFIQRGCFAKNMVTGEVKQTSYSGYISRDLTVRKAIANAFQLSSFRK